MWNSTVGPFGRAVWPTNTCGHVITPFLSWTTLCVEQYGRSVWTGGVAYKHVWSLHRFCHGLHFVWNSTVGPFGRAVWPTNTCGHYTVSVMDYTLCGTVR